MVEQAAEEIELVRGFFWHGYILKNPPKKGKLNTIKQIYSEHSDITDISDLPYSLLKQKAENKKVSVVLKVIEDG